MKALLLLFSFFILDLSGYCGPVVPQERGPQDRDASLVGLTIILGTIGKGISWFLMACLGAWSVGKMLENYWVHRGTYEGMKLEAQARYGQFPALPGGTQPSGNNIKTKRSSMGMSIELCENLNLTISCLPFTSNQRLNLNLITFVQRDLCNSLGCNWNSGGIAEVTEKPSYVERVGMAAKNLPN